MRSVFSYCIIILAITSFFPATPRLFFRLISSLYPAAPQAVESEKQDQTATMHSVSGIERSVTIDPGTIYIGDDGGVGLVYEKEFIVRSVGNKNILSLRVAGMVGVRNDDESEAYNNGFYTNELYINGQYIDNLNNYVYQEEDRTFRTILVPLPSDVLHPGRNKLIVMAKGPKDGNHDDFAIQAIKIVQ
jgi:hypothetical protein